MFDFCIYAGLVVALVSTVFESYEGRITSVGVVGVPYDHIGTFSYLLAIMCIRDGR